jgi:4-hydroxy-3-methylbut-2-enyl diphosphate reductase
LKAVIDACRARFDMTMETVKTADESVTFKLPRVLAR